MKTLYININNEQIESTKSIEVLNFNLLDDFFFYLGDGIVEDLNFHADKISLVKDFNTPENASDFDEILKQWEELKSILFGEKPEGIFEIKLPNGYIDWLRYNSNDEYRKIYGLKYSNSDRSVVSLDVDDFYTSCVKRDLLRKIKSKVCKINMSFDEIVIGLKAIHSSFFEKEIKEAFKIKTVIDDLTIDNMKLFASVKNNNKWITIDIKGNHIDSFKHVLHYDFNDGLSPVLDVTEWGFMDAKSNLIIPYKYKYVKPFSSGLAYVNSYTNEGFKSGFIDKEGNQVIPCIYDDAESFSDGLAMVVKKTKYGFINVQGHPIIPLIYTDAGSFSDGLTYIRQPGRYCDKEYLKYGFIDKEGNQVIPCIYDDAESFSDGLAAVKKANKWGFIDKEGNQVIPCIYDSVFSKGWYAGWSGRYSFRNGLARVRKANKWGFIDKEGNQVVPCIYDAVESFSDGLAAIKKANKWGFINEEGNQVIPCIYDDVRNTINYDYHFHNEFARVIKANKWGFIDKEGNQIIPCIYDMAFDFCNIN